MLRENFSQIEEIVSSNPDYTPNKVLLTNIPQLTISIAAISNVLKTLMVTPKKSYREIEKVNNEHYIEARKNYGIWFNETLHCNHERTIFVNLHFQRQQAYSERGTTANVTVPSVRGRSVSL